MHVEQIAAVLTAKSRIAAAAYHARYSLYFTIDVTLKCPFPLGDPEPPLIDGFLGPPDSIAQTELRSVHPFL